MNEGAWKQINDAQANLQPTPPIGKEVQWYKDGNTSEARAALVTGIEGPGRLKLVVFSVSAFPEHKLGVYHVSSDIHKIHNNLTTRRCGSWDYLPGARIPQDHYLVHKTDIQKRIDNLTTLEDQARKMQAAKVAKQLADINSPPPPDVEQKVDALAVLVSKLVDSQSKSAASEIAADAKSEQPPQETGKRLKPWQKLAKKNEEAEAAQEAPPEVTVS